jgi:hypothetical protein
VTCQILSHAQWWSRAITSNSSGRNIIKSCAGKRYWPHLRVHRLSQCGPGGPLSVACRPGTCMHKTYKINPMAPDPFSVPESSGSATCPEAQSTPPTRRGLRCHHMPHGTERATHQERAPMSPHAPRHRVRHPPGKGSGVATCPEAPSPSPDRRWLWSRHVPHGSRPAPCA